jgi:hypothetical protein
MKIKKRRGENEEKNKNNFNRNAKDTRKLKKKEEVLI